MSWSTSRLAADVFLSTGIRLNPVGRLKGGNFCQQIPRFVVNLSVGGLNQITQLPSAEQLG